VSQFGVGDDQDVALFNAGDEGDAFKIDSSGNSHFYKEVNIVKDVSFDTILIRRTDATNEYINLRTLQVYANNINILPSATNATQSIESGSLGDVIEFMTWNDLVVVSNNDIQYASNIRNNILSDFVVHSPGKPYISLYIPLTQSFNISDIQSFVLYNRPETTQVRKRINGFQIELYNRSNGFTPGTNVLYSMPINTTANVYRFDLPAITSYTGGFSTPDSQTQIKDITVSASQNFYTTLLKVEGGNTELGGDLSVGGVINQTGASWSLGGFGAAENFPYSSGSNIPFSVFQTPVVNCSFDNDTITIQKSGKYLINFGALSENNTNSIQMRLIKNNVNIIAAFSSGSGHRMPGASMILSLEVNDTISVYLNEGTMHPLQRYRFFNGYLIG
jgi:hypothetical protein